MGLSGRGLRSPRGNKMDTVFSTPFINNDTCKFTHVLSRPSQYVAMGDKGVPKVSQLKSDAFPVARSDSNATRSLEVVHF